MSCRRDETVVHLLMKEDEPIKDSLERSLRPLWRISYYGCVLLDWCRRIPTNRNSLFILIHYVVIAVSLFILTSSVTFQSVQLVREIVKPDSTIHSVIPNLMWFCNFPSALVTSMVFLIRRHEFSSFFKHWALLEQQISWVPSKKLSSQHQKLYVFVYGVYGLMTIGLIIGVSGLLLILTEATYLFSHFTVIREILTRYGTVMAQLISVLIAWFFICMADLVPTWTFYHAGRMLEHLELDFQDCNFMAGLKSSNDVQQLFSRYEKVSRLTDRANHLFGWLIIVNQSIVFFVNCAQFYTVLSTLKEADWYTCVFGFGFLSFSFRLVATTLMTAHLRTSFDKLKSTVLKLASRKRFINQELRKELKMFSNQMIPLAARPLNLYEIKPSTLVTIVSLTVSYAIVLLQSK